MTEYQNIRISEYQSVGRKERADDRLSEYQNIRISEKDESDEQDEGD